MTPRRRGLLLKAGGSVLAAGLATILFLLSRPAPLPTGPGNGPPGPATPEERKAAIALVDREIDSVLAAFGIDSAGVKKRSYEIPEENFTRTERFVPLPESVAPVSVNAALNDMARRYGGRAVAAENPRMGTVTIHLELSGVVVHTVILKKSPRNPAPGGRQPRPAT